MDRRLFRIGYDEVERETKQKDAGAIGITRTCNRRARIARRVSITDSDSVFRENFGLRETDAGRFASYRRGN